jgi:molybdopterin synthase sulfur carrier subunit
MSIKVKLLASLADRFGVGEVRIEPAPALTVAAVWDRATGSAPFATNTLAAVNHEYASVETVLKDGDEVAFFPPITGG